MSNLKDTKRLILISDTHFGVRSNNLEWLTIQEDYFKYFFIPFLKENVRPGDRLLHLGDVYDNRQSINIRVLNKCMEIFEEMSKILPIDVILGNHDCFNKLTNEMNSVKTLKYIPNVNVYEEPALLQYGNSKCLLMPWRNGPEEELETLKNFPNAEYLFCHTDFRGMKFNKWVEVEHGNSLDVFNAFKRVYSGHIHYGQQKDNINLIGSPYELTRSDRGNNKGIYILDLETGKETFTLNNYSPQFLRLDFEFLLNKSIDEINEIISDNFIDIAIHSKWILNYPINIFLDLLKGYRKIGFDIINSEQEMILNEKLDLSQESFNILKFAKEYIETLNYDPKLKEMLFKNISELYNRILTTTRNE